MPKSILQENPRSKVIDSGYINIYSQLNPKERRQIYYKTKYKDLNPNWDETQVFLSKEFKKLIKQGMAVLDAGCGHGNYVIDENRREISWAVGVDTSEEAVTNNICLDEIKICDLAKLPFENNTFDVVISLWVLEHLKLPEAVFSEIYRVLKPGGIFMFATPNKNFLPLAVTRFLKLNKFLNKLLFGRQEKDVFTTFYQANTLDDLKKLSEGKFKVEKLMLNYDPGYTSFNNFTFAISAKFKVSFMKPHIIGILRK
jgi:2-polyprenyl-3-methyl-5-hydroxy-6-metoxy-1,4-benzoquinol methylase